MTGVDVVNGDDELLIATEVAALARVDTKTLGRWRANGTGPPWVRLGPVRIAYPKKALAAWLDQQPRAAAS